MLEINSGPTSVVHCISVKPPRQAKGHDCFLNTVVWLCSFHTLCLPALHVGLEEKENKTPAYLPKDL